MNDNYEVSVNVAYNVLRLAAGGGFYNVLPATAAWFYFKVEVKNFCLALFVSVVVIPLLLQSAY
jgi:hypothetical protein